MIKYITLGLLIMLSAACSEKKEKKFRLVPSSESGITFRNVLTESPDFNIFNYLYFYNGGGVATGDVNGDNLPDIFFTSNQELDKLYLNQGNFKFKDVTSEAGVGGFSGWTTGVTMADVNSDGKLDIYVSYLGDFLIYKGKNQLFINEGNNEQGVPKFSDKANEYGLDLVGFSTQAAFFDYDRDGDLDMFMLNHSVHNAGTYGKSTLRRSSHPLAGDRLLKNDNGKFVDVTQGSGIYNSVLGYGLGVVVSDVNLDGWPDIYVGNDFHENDYLYMNQGNGTFKEVLEQQMNHTSRYTMGVDLADFNNDAFPDLITMDMLPEDPLVLKASMAEDPYDVYNFKIGFGYNHQFARNTLQINNHDGSYSDIALLSGVHATDWSWSTFFADFDLDGNKDIFVANGIQRRSNDLDYINFITLDSIQKGVSSDIGAREMKYAEKMPKIKIPNYLFINNGDSTFTNKALDWGMEQPSYSQGAAYADLDNDGDLDLVVNNAEDEAFVYENQTISTKKGNKDLPSPHFLKINFKGKNGNLFGIGAKVFVYAAGKVQMQECMPTRGFQSAVDYRLVFGLGSTPKVDSLVVVWVDGTFQRMNNVNVDQQIVADQSQAKDNFDYSVFLQADPLFVNVSGEVSIPYRHRENSFVEFHREALIPHMISCEGPASAVADVNNDGREDIFLGGAKRKVSYLFIQGEEGKFQALPQPVIEADSVCEDVDAVFFDADGDKDNDLIVISGGNEYTGKSLYLKPRLYISDGKGNFSKGKGLPEIFLNGSCVSVSDFDRDGDADLFVGARSIPWKYGVKPDSYLLVNDGKGSFNDETVKLAPVLRKFAMVKHAVWADIDSDKDDDLLIAAEWEPITILLNDKGKLERLPLQHSGLEKSNGWWNVLYPADFDRDGDLDLIAGNLGLNSRLKASVSEPVKLFVADFDKNDSIDQILSHFISGKEYPFHTRDEMTRHMPSLKKKYLSYHKFAEATLYDMFSKEKLDEALRYDAYVFQSCYIENRGNNSFTVKPLPLAAQFSTVNAIQVGDFNSDKNLDVLLAGNFFPINIQMGRNDASYGLLLTGDGKGEFKALAPAQSGFSVRGETRALREIKVNSNDYYVAVRNNDSIVVHTIRMAVTEQARVINRKVAKDAEER